MMTPTAGRGTRAGGSRESRREMERLESISLVRSRHESALKRAFISQMVFKSGDYYEGSFRYGVPHGEGK